MANLIAFIRCKAHFQSGSELLEDLTGFAESLEHKIVNAHIIAADDDDGDTAKALNLIITEIKDSQNQLGLITVDMDDVLIGTAAEKVATIDELWAVKIFIAKNDYIDTSRADGKPHLSQLHQTLLEKLKPR